MIEPYQRAITVDLGTGDGRFVYESARRCPQVFFIGIDACPQNLVKYSAKIYKKPARGGLPNALYIHANVEALPDELASIANRVTIHFPWGSLLKAVVQPDEAVLQQIRKIAQEGATLSIVLGYDAQAERDEIQRLVLPALTSKHFRHLEASYERAGFRLLDWQGLSRVDLKTLPTSWAKKLAYGQDRAFYQLIARVAEVPV